MSKENIEIVEAEVVEAENRIEKLKAALKKVDPKVYAAAAVAAVGALGYAAYKRIDNYEEREISRIIEVDDVEIIPEI